MERLPFLAGPMGRERSAADVHKSLHKASATEEKERHGERGKGGRRTGWEVLREREGSARLTTVDTAGELG
ncbi:unnamed protein product [Lampetra planeri]